GRREYRVSHPDASFVHTAVCRLYGNGHAACCPHGGQRKDDHLLRIVHNPDVRGWKGAGIQYCRNHLRSFHFPAVQSGDGTCDVCRHEDGSSHSRCADDCRCGCDWMDGFWQEGNQMIKGGCEGCSTLQLARELWRCTFSSAILHIKGNCRRSTVSSHGIMI